MTRVAAVDLGTTSTRLLVADIEDGRIRDVERETRVTRLGEGVDGRGRLLPLPIARVRNILTEYRRTLEELGADTVEGLIGPPLRLLAQDRHQPRAGVLGIDVDRAGLQRLETDLRAREAETALARRAAFD